MDSYTERIGIALREDIALENHINRWPGLLPLIMEAAGCADQLSTLNAALSVLQRLVSDPKRLAEIIDVFELEDRGSALVQ